MFMFHGSFGRRTSIPGVCWTSDTCTETTAPHVSSSVTATPQARSPETMLAAPEGPLSTKMRPQGSKTLLLESLEVVVEPTKPRI